MDRGVGPGSPAAGLSSAGVMMAGVLPVRGLQACTCSAWIRACKGILAQYLPTSFL